MMKSKKNIAKMILVAFVLTLVLPAGAFAADTKTASDLSGHWAQATVQRWMDQGLIGGYADGTFRPDQAITRAEFVKLLNKAIGAKTTGTVAFSDVSENDWFYGELQLAMGAGYVGGFEDGTFRPNDTVTRAQAAAFIVKAKQLPANVQAAERFVDQGAIADWAKGAVGAAAQAGYIGGYQDGTFQADKALTRAEAVSMLDRVLQAADKAKDEQKPAVSGGGSSSGSSSGGGGGSSVDKNDINTTAISYDASAGALSVKADTTINAAALNGATSVKTLTVNSGVNDVTIEGITVTGTTTINGGGSNSVHFKSCQLQGPVALSKKDVHVSLESGTTVAQTIVVNQPAILSVEGAAISQPIEAKDDLTLRAGTVPAVNVVAAATVAAEASSSAAVGTVTIATTAPVTVAAPAEAVIVAQPSQAVTLASDVQTVAVNAATTVSVADGKTVSDLQAKAATTVAGAGSVTSATIDTTAPVVIGANAATVNVSAAQAQVTVDADVTNVNVSSGATITVNAGSTVNTIASTATGNETVTVAGSGNVTEVVATNTNAVTVDEKINGDSTAPSVVQAYAITTVVQNLQGQLVTGAVTTTLPDVAKAGEVKFTAAVKPGYELISVAAGQSSLTAQNGSYSFTMGSAATTVTITVAEQPQWKNVPTGVSATALAQNGTAYTTTLSGTTTAAIENAVGELFEGVENTNNKFAQCVLNLGGLKAETTYTVTQVNKALTAAYPDAFTNDTKTKTYTGQELAEGLAILVWQGETNPITLTIQEGQNMVRTITITNATTAAPVAVTSVTLNQSTLTLAVEGQATLTATVQPDNAANKAVTWSSSNTAVATVNAAGQVTAVSAGTATITVTTADGSKTAICTVTVKDGKVKDWAELTAALAETNLTTITLADEAAITAIQNSTVTIPEGKTVIIPAGASLSGAEYISNNGTLVVNDAAGLALGAAVGGNITLGSDITLTDNDEKGAGKTFSGTLDGQNHKIDYRNLAQAANNGVFAENAKNAVIKNVTLYPNQSDISPFICQASGQSFTYEQVNICSAEDKYTCLVSGNDNNESAYLNFSSASATTFKNCSNYLSYTSSAAKTYLSAFLGGYMNVSAEATLTFEGCSNYGDLQMSHPAVFVGNGWNMGQVTIQVTDSYNHGKVLGTADAKLFAAISHDKLKQDYDVTYASAKAADGRIDTIAAAWLTIEQNANGTITFAPETGADTAAVKGYKVSYTAMAKAEDEQSQSTRSILLNYTISATANESLKPYQMIGKKEAEAAGITLSNATWNEFFYGITYTIVEEPCCLVFDFSRCTSNEDGKSFTLNVAKPEVTVTAVDKDGNPLGMAKLTYTVTPTPITPKEVPAVQANAILEDIQQAVVENTVEQLTEEGTANTTDNQSSDPTGAVTSNSTNNESSGQTEADTTTSEVPEAEDSKTGEQPAE